MQMSINIESCKVNENEWNISIYEDVSETKGWTESLQRCESFYKKAEKLAELAVSSIIQEILNEQDIRYIEDDVLSYGNALNEFTNKTHKKIAIEKGRGSSTDKFIRQTRNLLFYMSSDGYILTTIKVLLR